MTPITDEQLWGSPPPVLRLPPGMRWQAQRDGVGHLLPRSAATVQRYLCGGVPVAERYAWPVTSRCAACVAVLEEGR